MVQLVVTTHAHWRQYDINPKEYKIEYVWWEIPTWCNNLFIII